MADLDIVNYLDDRLVNSKKEMYIPHGASSISIQEFPCQGQANTNQLLFLCQFNQDDQIDPNANFYNSVTYQITIANYDTANDLTLGNFVYGQDFFIHEYPITTTAFGVCTSSINGIQVDSKELNRYGSLLHYLCDSKYANNNNTCPSKIPTIGLVDNELYTVNSSIGSFDDATYNSIGSLSFSDLVVGPAYYFNGGAKTLLTTTALTIPKPAAAAAGATVIPNTKVIYVDVQSNEPIPLNPYQYDGGKPKEALIGVKTLGLSFAVSPLTSGRAILGCGAGGIVSATVATKSQVQIQSASISSWTASKVRFNVLKRPDVLNYQIPAEKVYKCIDIDPRTFIDTLTIASQPLKSAKKVISNGACEKVLVYAAPEPNQYLQFQHEMRYPQTKVQMNVGNRQNLYANYNPIDNFKMTKKHLKKMSYPEFIGSAGVMKSTNAGGGVINRNYGKVGTMGPIFAIEPSIDFPLDLGVQVGQPVPLTFDFDVTLSEFVDPNIKIVPAAGGSADTLLQVQGKVPTLYVVFVQSNFIKIDTLTGAVSQQSFPIPLSMTPEIGKAALKATSEVENNIEGGQLFAKSMVKHDNNTKGGKLGKLPSKLSSRIK